MSATHHITINQGSTFKLPVTLRAKDTQIGIDLSTAVIRAQIRQNYGDASPVATFLVEDVDLANGKFLIRLNPDVTSDLAFIDDLALWDLEVEYSLTEKVTYLEGRARLIKEVTR